jgi:cold shock CspA family protein
MATFDKREKEKKRQQKQQEKQRKKEERKLNPNKGGLENMMAYVDENGQLTSTPPDPTKQRKPIEASEIELGVPRRVDVPMDAERHGRVDFFDTTKGFGFINEDGTGERYFVHKTGLIDEIREGDKVKFELERGPKGMNAVRVQKA